MPCRSFLPVARGCSRCRSCCDVCRDVRRVRPSRPAAEPQATPVAPVSSQADTSGASDSAATARWIDEHALRFDAARIPDGAIRVMLAMSASAAW